MQDPFRAQAAFTRVAVDDFISPSGSAIAAALAAAQSSTALPTYSEHANPFSTPLHHNFSVNPTSTTFLRAADAPSLGLKHDFMVMPGVNMESAVSTYHQHREPSFATVPWTSTATAIGTGSSTNFRDPYPVRGSPGATMSSVTHIPASYRSLNPIGDLPPKRKQSSAPPAGPTPSRTRGVRKKSRGPARFFCQLVGCGKAFRMQGDLQTHMRLHTGEEPFVCSFPFCGRKYKWRSSLAHHEGLHLRKKGALSQRRPRRSKKSSALAVGEGSQQAESSTHGSTRRVQL